MTHDMVAPDPDVLELATSVKGLSRGVTELASRTRRNRLLVVVAIAGLILDLALSGLFLRQRAQQVCLNDLRAAGAAIADSDRANVDKKLAADSALFSADAKFFADVFSAKTPEAAQAAFRVHVAAVQANQAAAAQYTARRAANDHKRAQLGTGNAGTCPLF